MNNQAQNRVHSLKHCVAGKRNHIKEETASEHMAWTSAPSTIQLTRTEHKRQNASRQHDESVAIKVSRLRTATVQLTHDGQRTGSCPLTHCNMLLGLKPCQLNHRKKGDELLLLIYTPSNLASVHDGNAAELTHSQQGAQSSRQLPN